jgi:hypothetical protein
MASRRDEVKEARGLSKSSRDFSYPRAGSYFACKETDEVTENLASLYGEKEKKTLMV